MTQMVPSHREETKKASSLLALLIRALIPGWGHPLASSKPNHVPKAPPTNTITSGVGAPTCEFGGTHSVMKRRKIVS